MRKMLVTATALAAALAVGALPSAHATTAAVQENVRHLTNVPGTTGGHVAVEEDTLYMGNYGIGMSMYDISDPRNPVQIGEYRPDRAPVADAVPDAAHYEERKLAILGGTSRAGSSQTTDFLDVTDPANPVVLHSLSGAVGESHNTDIVDERKWYLPSGGGAGLRIYDISPLLETPAQPPVLLSSNNPRTLWLESPFRGERSIGPSWTHIHDITVYTDLSVLLTEDQWVDQDGDEIPDPTYGPRDIALLAEGGNYLGNGNTGAFTIVDITDPENPVARLRWTNDAGHPVRYFHEAQLLDADPHIAFISDEDLHNGCEAGGVLSVALSEDYTEITKLDEWFNGTGTPAPVCSAHVFSTAGDYVFMGSYNAGLQVIDFSDPENLTRAGQYIAEGANAWGALYHEGVIYTGDFGGRGLDVFEFIHDPVASGLVKVGNPTSRLVAPGGGVSEIAGACDPAAPTNDLDGLFVEIPEDKRDGSHTIRGVAAADGVYDLDVWFYTEDCTFMGGISEDPPTMSGDVEGSIPEEAAYAYVDLFAGAAARVWAQIDYQPL